MTKFKADIICVDPAIGPLKLMELIRDHYKIKVYGDLPAINNQTSTLMLEYNEAVTSLQTMGHR